MIEWAMAMKATDALLTDHRLVRKVLEGFRLDNPTFSKIALTLHRALRAHAWFEDEIFLPVLKREPLVVKRFMAEIEQEHQDLDALMTLVRGASKKSKELDAYALQLRSLLDTHFAKEEDALFPLAEKVLSNEGLLELGAEMKRRQTEVRKFIELPPLD